MSQKRSPSWKETLIFIINVGVPKCDTTQNISTFDKIKHIVQHLLQKKIFTRPNDEVGLILMGSSNTKNDLQINNISELCDVMKPDWDLVEKVLKLENTKIVANWVEALYVAVEYIKRECEDPTLKTILLLSDFNEDKDLMIQFQPESIAKELKQHSIKLLAIGKDPINELPEDSLTVSIKILQKVCEMIDGKYLTLDNAMADTRFYSVAAKSGFCFYDLKLLDLSIPVVSYVKVSEELKLPSWKLAKDGNENTSTEQTELSEPDRVNRIRENYDSNNELCPMDDIAISYMYGGELVPFRDEDEKAMNYKGDVKSLQILSFADRDTISVDYWTRSPVHVIVPAAEDAVTPFYDLAQAMIAENVVAITRKVWRQGDAPKMTALYPRINVPNEPWCFVQLELPFCEDYTVHEMRPLKSILKRVTTEQDEIVENLLDSLMLPDVQEEDDHEGLKLFLPGCLPSPSLQNLWNMLAYRALHPNEPLPPIADYLKELFDPPKSVKEKSAYFLKQMEELFRLKEEEKEKSAGEAENLTDKHHNDETIGVEKKPIGEKKNEKDDEKIVLKVDTIEEFDDMMDEI